MTELVPPTEAELVRWLPPLAPGSPRHPLRSDEAAAAWNGVVWGRLGRGDHAWAWWDAVTDESLLPWVAGERGRLLRELGLYEQARELELDGLAAVHDLVDAVLLRLSLTADAIGLGRPEVAASTLEGASALLDELPDSPRLARQRLRRTWVGVELAIARGAQPRADGLPSRGSGAPTFPVDHDAGTDFHRAKGLLFAGVVREDPGLLRQAAGLAPPALRWAVELALLDTGDEGAAGRAVAAWSGIVPPPPFAAEVAAAPTARRIAVLAAG